MTWRRWRNGAAVLGTVATLSLLSASPATAEDEITIDHVETSRGLVTMIVSVDGVPGESVGGSSVSVQIDGEAVDSQANTVSAGDVTRTTILVVDASNSMRGAKFDSATEAVKAFLLDAPDDVLIGMVAFAGKVGTTVPPTQDRGALLEKFTQLELASGTGVYDAVAAAVKLAGKDGSRSLLLLSDGADTGSAATLDEVAAAAAKAEVVIDVVSIGSAAKADTLSTFATETTGQVIPADPEALGTVFADQANALAQQLLVTVELPDGASGDADISVSVEADGTTYDDSALVNVGKSASNKEDGPTAEVVSAPLVSTPMMLAGAGALFLGLTILLGTVLFARASGQSSAEKRLGDYFGQPSRGGAKKASTSTDLKGSAVAATDRMVSQDLETRLTLRLQGAGSALTAAEWILLHAGIAVVSAFIGFVLFGGLLGFVFLVLGAILPWRVLKWRHKRRRNAFNSQLAETLDMMAGGLQAGLSLPQAVDTVVRQGSEPMVGELRRSLVEQRLGVDITDSLESLGLRMESDDFAWVVMAIRIQRDVGGNLAEILRTVSDTLREREYLRRQVRALSAEGRISGYILTAMPVLVFFYMMLTNRDYVSVLYTTFIGWILIGIATFLLLLGGFAMKKLATVEV